MNTGYYAGEVRHGMRTVDRERCLRLCVRKFRYATSANAAEGRSALQRPHLRVYYCEWCLGYHLGTPGGHGEKDE